MILHHAGASLYQIRTLDACAAVRASNCTDAAQTPMADRPQL